MISGAKAITRIIRRATVAGGAEMAGTVAMAVEIEPT
jgi:hypothetical protein